MSAAARDERERERDQQTVLQHNQQVQVIELQKKVIFRQRALMAALVVIITLFVGLLLVERDRQQAVRAQRNTFSRLVTLSIQSPNADTSRSVCLYGSIAGFGEVVLPACDHGVALTQAQNPDEDGPYRDARGVALALIGEYERAVEDFEAAVRYFASEDVNLYDQYGYIRDEWIARLRQGQNPFDERGILALLSEL
jgi:tetratricopeptide (TPR) repeat protein